jgi:hypothetical protein
MTEITWGRTNQLGDFVGVLEFRAIDLYHHARVSEQNLCGGFHDARFAGSRGSQEQKVTNWTPRRIQTGTKYLVEVDERLHAFLLPNDLGAQGVVKVARIIAADAGIELLSGGGFHGYSPQQVKPLASPLAQVQGASRKNNIDFLRKTAWEVPI